ncbi:MAG: hypothetical protein HY566_00310 [Candidatus Kerfeldbacteria bacterium]|nr:hypothetical protein [Candidatus Kerfeldbacteria bacterium]
MKVDLHIFDRWKLHDEQDRLIHWAALTLTATVTVATVFALYLWVYRSIISPSPIDPTRITASQKKINKAALDSILQFNEQKQSAADTSGLRDPFSASP